MTWLRYLFVINSFIHSFIIFNFVFSTVATILDAAKADQDQSPDPPIINETVVMLSLAIFILSAPKDVILAGNLLEQSMNVFRRCVKSTDPQVFIFVVIVLCLHVLDHCWLTKRGRIFVLDGNMCQEVVKLEIPLWDHVPGSRSVDETMAADHVPGSRLVDKTLANVMSMSRTRKRSK